MPKHESVDSSSDEYKYDVFLSFKGEDTRKTFTDHLYTALVNEGLIVFRDNEEIERGETIKSELEEGIQESRSWIIVFSEKYAFSSWCLDQLVMILQCKNNSNRLLLPIFYHVHPSDIRKQSGSVSQAFYMHGEKFNREVDDTKRKELMDKIKRWRAALTQVADLAGMTLQNETNGYEAEFIKKIVKVVDNKVNHLLSLPRHLVGITASANAINVWIRNGSTNLEVFALYGIGGVGKTTIAKYIYNTNIELFEGGSFLENIRDYSERWDGLVCLQRQLLVDISKGNTPTINNINDGIRKIQRAVRLRKLLIVLDDIDQVEQLDAIFGMRECFHPGSKIILTTRDVDLLKAREPCTRHAVETLDLQDSLELFSRHAFRDSCPPEYYMEDSQRILKQCEGLPLALEVLGAYLRDKEADVWRSAVEKLEVIPHHKIQKILQLSYESLEDDYDKNLFLDIACFFNGEAKSRVVMILDECKYHTRIGIEKLIDRCLLKIDIFEKLRMHCLIQSMGREIIRQESPKEPGERSRLWHHKDSLEVLEDETGTRAIEGLALELNRTDVCQVELRTSAFSRMHKLRLLKLDNVRLNGSYEDFPKKLEWLCWHRCPLKALPKGFPSISLVSIEMQRSKLQKLGQGSMLFKSLKLLDLSHSHDLVKSPNFTELIALKQLILEDCVSLGEIDESIGMAAGLVLLNLKDCELLKTLPKNMGMLKSLEILIISGCSNLIMLPIEMKNMESLKSFHADGVDFGNSIARSQEHKSWLNFIRDWVLAPRRGLQLSFTYLPSKSITKLSLVNCNLHDDDFPKGLFFGHSVEHLDLSENPISFLPDCFKGLKRLKELKTKHCQQLQALEDIPYMLEKIYADECPLLGKITFSGPFKFYACNVNALSCQKLIEVGSLYKMVPIGEIDSKFINSCGISDPEGMKKMQIRLWNKTTGERSCPIQGIFEETPYGNKIFNISYPGSSVPTGFMTERNASSISFTVSDSKLRYLNICVVLKYIFKEFLVIHNRTKHKIFIYQPYFCGMTKDEDMIWLSQWTIGSHEMGPGDEVKIWASQLEDCKAREIGVSLVYEEEEEVGVGSSHQICEYVIPGEADEQVYYLGNLYNKRGRARGFRGLFDDINVVFGWGE